MDYKICHTWDNEKFDHQLAELRLTSCDVGVQLSVEAQFFNDPQSPPGSPGQSFQNLWEYEVVEAFFLNDKNMYLEVELCPHGQYLVLLLNGCRKCVKDQLPINYSSNIKGDRWQGTAVIPDSYFPPNITKFNAYAIHGSGDKRKYEALYPVPKDKYAEPDFHRLEYFQGINLNDIMPKNYGETYKSVEWEQHL